MILITAIATAAILISLTALTTAIVSVMIATKASDIVFKETHFKAKGANEASS